LAALRVKLQQQLLSGPLFDIKRFTRNLEQAFELAIERKMLHLPNDHFDTDT
jgi:predicted O-linked N-acetylglucosamine transferase (SPINDLY family)